MSTRTMHSLANFPFTGIFNKINRTLFTKVSEAMPMFHGWEAEMVKDTLREELL